MIFKKKQPEPAVRTQRFITKNEIDFLRLRELVFLSNCESSIPVEQHRTGKMLPARKGSLYYEILIAPLVKFGLDVRGTEHALTVLAQSITAAGFVVEMGEWA